MKNKKVEVSIAEFEKIVVLNWEEIQNFISDNSLKMLEVGESEDAFFQFTQIDLRTG